MSRITCKFGGSSVASVPQYLKIQKILDQDPRRQIIVVSAPGKRHSKENKLTDLLYLCHDEAQKHMPLDAPFGLIRERFVEIEKELGLDAGIAVEMEKFRQEILDGGERDYIASRGEYFSGKLVAKFLKATFIDP